MNKNSKSNALKTAKGLGSGVCYADQGKIERKHLKAGDISGKVPIVSADGRTVRYCSPEDYPARNLYWQNKENEIITSN